MSMERDRLGDDFRDEPKRNIMTPAIIATAVIVAVILIFVLQNRERMRIDFLFVEINSRVWVALAIAVVLGVLLDRVLLFWWRRRRRSDR